jgi:hypothetical protein
MSRSALAPRRGTREAGRVYTETLVAVGGLLPLAVMLALLFAAVWLRDARV